MLNHEASVYDSVYVHNWGITPPDIPQKEAVCKVNNVPLIAGGFGSQYGFGCERDRTVSDGFIPNLEHRVNAHAASRFWLDGANTSTLELNWNSAAFTRNFSVDPSPYSGVDSAASMVELDLVITGAPPGLVNVWFTYHAYSGVSHIEEGPGDTAVVNAALVLAGTDLFLNAGHQMSFGTQPGQVNNFNTVIDGGVMNVMVGTPFKLRVDLNLWSRITPTGRVINGWEEDDARANSRGTIILSVHPIPVPPANTLAPTDLGLFSTDIGGDASISDPMPNNSEYFDPGDAYQIKGPVMPQGGVDGMVDDENYLGGTDLWPDAPDPASSVPLFTGFLDPIPFTDMDGIDVLDFEITNPSVPYFVTGNQNGLKTFEHLFLSFDDDTTGNYTNPMVSVPAASNSPLSGQVFGTTQNKDEIVETYISPIAPFKVQSIRGVYDEEDIHTNLAPNPVPSPSPFIQNAEDDDVDALDFSEGLIINPYVYVSVDHEATGHNTVTGDVYDPGIIYRITSPQKLTPAVLPADIGIPAGTDIDAFEFVLIPDAQTPFSLAQFAIVFSVDLDDPLTPGDESGGLHAAKLYASYMDGLHFELDSGFVFNENIDAIATWDHSLNGTVASVSGNADIKGTVYEDFNNNSAHDTNEGLTGVKIQLFPDHNQDGQPDQWHSPIDSTITDTAGNYQFSLVSPGDYVLIEEQPACYTSQRDSASTDYDIVMNINNTDDIIPVSIFLGESEDANNDFIELARPTIVKDTSDNTPFSLRVVLQCAQDGDTILFDPSLSGKTIFLTTARIILNKDVVILSQLNPTVTIKSLTSGAFRMRAGTSVEMRNLDIVAGTSGNQALIDNRGDLTLHDINIHGNTTFLQPALIKNMLGAQLEIKGMCKIFY